ncbi:V-type ATP synthase subunit D [Sharpea azabuensis]|uniref:V-type ATP synthase subunit D n=1 Tax=Sharpea azabuensis TaxID=322505 RepID=A0A1H6R7M2_9FIRM|nr:V-type ATP synthase subunit D [Sharpea azabuensis]HAJ16477.1 V-type ATP synthase subunit D [Erysipelotrichaceae bacterium]MDD6513240.1 V-type ATP synthase subunit D [Sharpea azabuensis]MEE3308784.1 V-type ATP synthase subunit D [Sharpea azabuensis]SEI47770.1 V/A-type H+-transporting ATPase subunit D [Sharpea azabuensis]SFD65323.1 V/A-type H+-transporting ATPase subunit D [Sharpea azabuensis]
MAQNVTPTKSNLMATQKSLALAKMGYNLLDKKRNVLIKEMMGLLDDVKLIRDQITDKYNLAYHALQEANISLGIISDIVEDVPVDYGIHVKYRSVMGVELPRIDYEESKLNLDYGFEQANSKVDYAYKCFSDVKELTVKLAEIENSVYRLANAIRQTSTRSNALKNISIPQFEKTVKMISESLEEKERESFSVQKVIKSQKERAQ